ncbi:hypothetical protein ACFYY8_18880 [Streptosporangium sp. NPDC001559]|uniref:hypothetical protein n=1 Tax=Streptosporangium sp. NPDC001559 TaxID=3366187 RepID=UPI0036E7D172
MRLTAASGVLGLLDAPQVREAATAAYALRDAATVEELRVAAVTATDRLVDVAGAHLAAVAGEKRAAVPTLSPSSVAQ